MVGILKNIRFKKVSVVVLSIEHISRVLVTWELEPTAQNLSNLKFFIERGESPSEFSTLNHDGVSSRAPFEYVDYTSNLIDTDKVYYYRVRAVEFCNGVQTQDFVSYSTTRDGDLDLVGLYVVEEHLFAHRYVYGVPAMIFKKIRDGVYCPECWDKVLKRCTVSNCKTCFGTGRLHGYYPPIEVWMSFEPEPKVEQVVDWGRRQPSQTDVQFTNYPILSCDDLIVELKPNKLWKVSRVQYPEKNRTIMLQILRLDAVGQTDIEYKLEVPEDRKRVLVAQLEEREKEREF